jgi:hypothetical protein
MTIGVQINFSSRPYLKFFGIYTQQLELLVLGFELRTLSGLGKCYTACIMPPALFALVVLEIGLAFSPGWPRSRSSFFYASHGSWDDRYALPHSAFFWGACKHFLQAGLGVCSPSLQYSWVDRYLLPCLAIGCNWVWWTFLSGLTLNPPDLNLPRS